MRLTIGQLRQVIREEVVRARRGGLREAAGGDDVAAAGDKGRKCSKSECEEYGWPRGTLIRRASDGIESEVKFPGEEWQSADDAVPSARGRRSSSRSPVETMTQSQLEDFDKLANDEGWSKVEKSNAARSFRQAKDFDIENLGPSLKDHFIIQGPAYNYVWDDSSNEWMYMDDLFDLQNTMRDLHWNTF